jgi:hypothetical protein
MHVGWGEGSQDGGGRGSPHLSGETIPAVDTSCSRVAPAIAAPRHDTSAVPTRPATAPAQEARNVAGVWADDEAGDDMMGVWGKGEGSHNPSFSIPCCNAMQTPPQKAVWGRRRIPLWWFLGPAHGGFFGPYSTPGHPLGSTGSP